jgi:creatinine amidohydrolase
MQMKKKGRLILIGSLCLFLALTGLSASAEIGVQKSRGSYSIFEETMVDLSWPEVEKAAKDNAIILFPTAVIEEHGPHMSLGVDTYEAYIKCKLLRRELEKRGIYALIAPPFYWGINVATAAWPGSFTSRPSTVQAVLFDALASLRKWGFLNVFFINFHGNKDHTLAICKAIEEARSATGVKAYYLMRLSDARPWGLIAKEYVLVEETPPPAIPPSIYLDPHAGKSETSMMAYYFPGQVDVDLARKLTEYKVKADDFAKWRSGPEAAKQITPLGYMDDPASFDPDTGRKSMEEAVGRSANVIESFMKGTYRPPTP